jgi:hypothetical protein
MIPSGGWCFFEVIADFQEAPNRVSTLSVFYLGCELPATRIANLPSCRILGLTALKTRTFMPGGGGKTANSVATSTMMPNQTRSNPCDTTMGAKSGTKIRMIAIEPITQPSIGKTGVRNLEKISARMSTA